MNKLSACALLLAPLLLVACKKTETTPAAVVVAPVAAPAIPAPAADPEKAADDEREMAKKKALLAFATMEDKYVNDPRAQWVASATASSTFKDGESEYNRAENMVGPVDDKEWTNDKQDMGFDFIELAYAKPVNATEVRLVLSDRHATEALTKIELQDAGGKWNEIWSGVSDAKAEENGPRTWITRTFPKTEYKVKAVKYTFANNVSPGYKVVDAAQLVGD